MSAIGLPLFCPIPIIGNRCGHVPDAPRWFEPPLRHAARPRILIQLQERLHDYYDDPTLLPSLNCANGSPRQQRSERREACMDLMGALVHYLDLASLRVGIPQADGSMRGLTMPFLAEVAGLNLRRAERACHDLVVAGLINIYPIAQHKADDHYEGLPAIRMITAALFKVFGLSKWLQRERDKAAKRQRRQQRKQSEADAGRQEINLHAAERRMSSTETASASITVSDVNATHQEHARTVLGQLLNQLRGTGPPART